jgi:thioesterase domain-containing protein
MAIELKTRIETDLVLSLPAGRLVQGPSIKKLAAEVLYQLAKEKEYGGEVTGAPEPTAPSAATPRLVPLRAGGAAPPLFCVHPGRGAADIYQAVANLLPPALPVYGVQSEVLNGSRSVEEMAKEHAHAVRGGQPEGPYYLLGFSLGGFIALATAKRLEEEGESVAFVGLIDCDAGWTNPSNFVVGSLISETYRLIQSGTSFLEPLSPDRLAEETARLSETLLAALPEERVGIIMQWLKKNGHVRKGLSQAALNEYLAAFNQHVALVADFEPPVVRAPLFVWWADEGLSSSGNGNRTWAGFTTGPVMERTLRGSHYSIMHPPAAALLAEEIGRSLAAVGDS